MAIPPILKLDQFLKLSRIVGTGGQAKILIQSGEVWVNGVLETRRGRKLQEGDQIQVGKQVLIVASADLERSRRPPTNRPMTD